MSDPVFKTIDECRLELVAHTMEVVEQGATFDGDRFCGADFLPVRAARASFGKEDKTGENPEADLKLMKYLADHEHLTPFEYNHATFLVECPLFVRSQIMRHRTFAFNEVSRRYTSEDIAFWVPDKWRAQSKSNKQASTDDEINFPICPGLGGLSHKTLKDHIPTDWSEDGWYGRKKVGRMNTNPAASCLAEALLEAHAFYFNLIKAGVSREQARAVLPQSLLTRFFMGGILRNWCHFLRLRLASDAQRETQVVAQRIERELRRLWPDAMGCLMGDASDA